MIFVPEDSMPEVVGVGTAAVPFNGVSNVPAELAGDIWVPETLL